MGSDGGVLGIGTPELVRIYQNVTLLFYCCWGWNNGEKKKNGTTKTMPVGCVFHDPLRIGPFWFCILPLGNPLRFETLTGLCCFYVCFC
jgi:hypothetical protein